MRAFAASRSACRASGVAAVPAAQVPPAAGVLIAVFAADGTHTVTGVSAKAVAGRTLNATSSAGMVHLTERRVICAACPLPRRGGRCPRDEMHHLRRWAVHDSEVRGTVCRGVYLIPGIRTAPRMPKQQPMPNGATPVVLRGSARRDHRDHHRERGPRAGDRRRGAAGGHARLGAGGGLRARGRRRSGTCDPGPDGPGAVDRARGRARPLRGGQSALAVVGAAHPGSTDPVRLRRPLALALSGELRWPGLARPRARATASRPACGSTVWSPDSPSPRSVPRSSSRRCWPQRPVTRSPWS